MSWNLDSSRPIYAQIIEKVSLDIVSGKYQPGDKLPSVRDLAAQAGVNPNTMQKALSELEKREPGSFRKNKRAIYYRGQSYD